MDPKSILESVWKNAGESSGRNWLMAAVMPSLIFWGACGLVYCGVVYGWAQTAIWWEGQTDTLRTLLLIGSGIVIIVTAFGLELFGITLLRLAEGYWENILLIGKPLQKWLRRRFNKPHTRWDELSKKLTARDHPELWKGSNKKKPENITNDEEIEFKRLDRQLHDLPPEEQMMPTRLGNILRSAELYPLVHYGLDSVVVWSRLYPILPDGFRRQIDDSRNALDAAVRLYFLAFLFSIIWAVEAALLYSWLLIIITLSGLFIAWLIWYSALGAAAVYGELIRSVFDLHRFDLYRALRLPMPANTEKERRLGEQITLFLWRYTDIEYDPSSMPPK
jgi:hypothetical protein